MSLTKAERSVAAQKAAKTRKLNEMKKERAKKLASSKRKRTMSAKPTGVLGDLFTPAAAQGGFDLSLNAGFGGGIAYGIDQLLMRKADINRRSAAMIIGGFLFAVAGNKPETGAGMIGAGTKQLLDHWRKRKGYGMRDGGKKYMMDNKFVQNLESLPPVLDANGVPMNDQYDLAQGQNGYNSPYTFASHPFNY